jgi:biotin carboxyl carrier protein
MKEYKITLNNHTYLVVIKKIQADSAVVEVNGKNYNVDIETKIKRHMEPLEVKPTLSSPPAASSAKRPPTDTEQAADNQIVAPLPGMIMDILVKEGDKISANQVVMKMEAMKMENDIKSDRDGIVEKIHVNPGEAVLENAALISLSIV